jgi:hypothetical protein
MLLTRGIEERGHILYIRSSFSQSRAAFTAETVEGARRSLS